MDRGGVEILKARMGAAILAAGQQFQRGRYFLGHLQILHPAASDGRVEAFVDVLDRELAEPLLRQDRVERVRQHRRARSRHRSGEGRLLLIAGSR